MIPAWAHYFTGIKLTTAGALSVAMLAVGGAYVAYQALQGGTGRPLPFVPPAGQPFSIAGTAQGRPAPGGTVPIRLAVTNPNPFPIVVNDLRVRVGAVATTDGDTARCHRGNFAVRQFTGDFGFVVESARTRSLADLGFRTAQWPQLVMLNFMANQDLCKSASVTLALTGTAAKAAS